MMVTPSVRCVYSMEGRGCEVRACQVLSDLAVLAAEHIFDSESAPGTYVGPIVDLEQIPRTRRAFGCEARCG